MASMREGAAVMPSPARYSPPAWWQAMTVDWPESEYGSARYRSLARQYDPLRYAVETGDHLEDT